MELTSTEVTATRFSGTRYVYNRREVDSFVRRVVTTLRDHERELARVTARMEALEHALDVAHAARTSRSRSSSERRRALDQAIRVAGAPRPPGTTAMTWDGFDQEAWLSWRGAMEAEYESAADLAMASEDARRLRGCALALAGEVEAMAETEAGRLIAAARDEAATEAVRVVGAARQVVLARSDVADGEVDGAEVAAATIIAEAEAEAAKRLASAEEQSIKAAEEAARMLETAEIAAAELTAAAEQEVEALNRRLNQLRTAVGQAEAFLHEVGPAAAAAEAAMAGDLIELEIVGSVTPKDEDDADITTVDLRHDDSVDDGIDTADDHGDEAPPASSEPRPSGFYERRLAGLRERLATNVRDE